MSAEFDLIDVIIVFVVAAFGEQQSLIGRGIGRIVVLPKRSQLFAQFVPRQSVHRRDEVFLARKTHACATEL